MSMRLPPDYESFYSADDGPSCVFCRIVEGKAPAEFLHKEEDIVVIRNQLTWVRVMLLVMPTQHMSQKQLWESEAMARAAKVAVEMGETHCPGGFRLLSNFGHQAMQSQSHAHLHVLGGQRLGPYV